MKNYFEVRRDCETIDEKNECDFMLPTFNLVEPKSEPIINSFYNMIKSNLYTFISESKNIDKLFI